MEYDRPLLMASSIPRCEIGEHTLFRVLLRLEFLAEARWTSQFGVLRNALRTNTDGDRPKGGEGEIKSKITIKRGRFEIGRPKGVGTARPRKVAGDHKARGRAVLTPKPEAQAPSVRTLAARRENPLFFFGGFDLEVEIAQLARRDGRGSLRHEVGPFRRLGESNDVADAWRIAEHGNQTVEA